MRKFAFLLAMLGALVVVLIPVVVAGGQGGPAGNSNIAHVDLRGPWGTMNYNLSGCTLDFVFNGHELVPGETYELRVRLGGGQFVVLGQGIANGGGNLHLGESVGSVESFRKRFVELYQMTGVTNPWRAIRSGTKHSFTCTCCD